MTHQYDSSPYYTYLHTLLCIPIEGLSPVFAGGKQAELYTGTFEEAEANSLWTLWEKTSGPPAPPAPPAPPTQPFKVEYTLKNMSVKVYLPVIQNVTVEVWVDATTQALRVESVGDLEHKLEATLEVWRTKLGPYPFSFQTCYSNITVTPDKVVQTSASTSSTTSSYVTDDNAASNSSGGGGGGGRGAGGGAGGGAGLLFYHRNPSSATPSSMFNRDLTNQQMPSKVRKIHISQFTIHGLRFTAYSSRFRLRVVKQVLEFCKQTN